MNRRSERAAFLLLGIVAAAFSFFCLTGIMRESDQASLITGSWNIFRKGSFSGDYYNYDKQYATYWLIAAAFKVRSFLGGKWSPVFIADLCAGLIFWLTTLTALVLLARRRRLPSPVILLWFLATPVVLINAVYANTAIVSAGFLILSSVLLQVRRRSSQVLAALCFFVAVGARGDAVLVAPLLIWLRFPSHKWLKRAFTSTTTWLMVLATLGALVLGSLVYTGEPQYGDLFDPRFNAVLSKTTPGYLVFGMGASLVAAMAVVASLAFSTIGARGVDKKFFYGSGALWLAAPLLYYSVQLYSPRYLLTTTLGIFIFLVSSRGIAFWRLTAPRSAGRLWRSIATAVAVVPLLAGARLPSLSRPHLVFSRPTLYPTTDGLHPMGAYLSFMMALRNFESREVDHNQLVWKAADSTRYIPSADGSVHLLETPMYTYLELGVTLQGLSPKAEPKDPGEPVYADTRSFMRLGTGLEAAATKQLLAKPSAAVSPSYDGIGIRRFNADGDSAWGKETTFLDRLFKANDYRIYTRWQTADLDGRPFTFISGSPFQVSGQTASLDDGSGLYFIPVSTAINPANEVQAGNPDKVLLVVQALPAWMSVAH